MRVSIRIPANMRSATNGQACIEAEGESVGGAIHGLVDILPELKPRLLSDFGELLSYEAVFVGGTDIRDMSGMESKLDSGKEILIVSALAGGDLRDDA